MVNAASPVEGEQRLAILSSPNCLNTGGNPVLREISQTLQSATISPVMVSL